ncbi:MAG TPA: hypothetical protein VNZ45_01460 [Bacteroidia bacterium]|nr:hypothetical protein [Bacteroidia bacterium]
MPLKKLSLFIFIPSVVLCCIIAFRPVNRVEYALISKIPLDGGSFTTDNLRNIYVYTNNSIKKYDTHDALLYSYSDKSYGTITSVDVTDPLKIMVFFKDFPEVIFLDNTLSLNGTAIGPSNLGFPFTTLACISHDNGAWLFDAQNLQLVRIDLNLNVTQKTGSLMQLLGFPVNPNYLLEYNDYVYMNDTAQGILTFDAYGTYYKTIPIKGLTAFELRGDDLFYTCKGIIHTFHLKTIMEELTPMPDSLATIGRIEKNMVFEGYKDTVRIYSVK